jgi:CRISPR/Cas system-associated endoribonuclease Cas2
VKTLITFDIPRCKSGKRLRMRILRKFAKEKTSKLQDSVWEVKSKRAMRDILQDFKELKDKIKSETKREPKLFIIKGEIEKF